MMLANNNESRHDFFYKKIEEVQYKIESHILTSMAQAVRLGALCAVSSPGRLDPQSWS